MLSTPDMKDTFFKNVRFLGCFIGDVNMTKFQDKILLAYQFTMDLNFIDFERKLLTHPSCLIGADYDYDNENIVIYVFNIPKEHLEDYQLVLDGKYSELSPTLKLKILKFWGDNKETSLLHSILFHGEKARKFLEKQGIIPEFYCAEGEYWFLPRLDNELFDIDRYRK